MLADDGKPYSVIGHLNGPGSVLREEVPDPPNAEQTQGATDVGAAATGEAAVPVFSGFCPNVINGEAMDPDYPEQTLLPKSPGSHSSEDFAVCTKERHAFLFGGTIKQNVIFHMMQQAVTGE